MQKAGFLITRLKYSHKRVCNFQILMIEGLYEPHHEKTCLQGFQPSHLSSAESDQGFCIALGRHRCMKGFMCTKLSELLQDHWSNEHPQHRFYEEFMKLSFNYHQIPTLYMFSCCRFSTAYMRPKNTGYI